MLQRKDSTNLTELLPECMAQPEPMLNMLEWLCVQLMEAKVSPQLGVEKNERTNSRSGYHGG